MAENRVLPNLLRVRAQNILANRTTSGPLKEIEAVYATENINIARVVFSDKSETFVDLQTRKEVKAQVEKVTAPAAAASKTNNYTSAVTRDKVANKDTSIETTATRKVLNNNPTAKKNTAVTRKKKK